MKNYKIIFTLQTPIIFNNRPVFDAILSYCYAREILKDDFGADASDYSFIDNLPLKQNEKRWFYGSFMFYDEGASAFLSIPAVKRWEERYAYLVCPSKIELRRGKFKNELFNHQALDTKKVWFYFTTDKIKEIESLLKKHLIGIGKKISLGYGLIKNFEIEELNYNPFEKVIRPIPFDISKKEDSSNIVFTGFRPPYWEPINQTYCIIK